MSRDEHEGLAWPGARLRVRGLVQGVGFRPHVWRVARALGLRGTVRNDGEGVAIEVWAPSVALINEFCARLHTECPPLAQIAAIERVPLSAPPPAADEFAIVASEHGAIHTDIVPDAALCAACRAEVLDPRARRARYPFANCTHCGPRLSIVSAIPYDRAHTSMARFPPCPDCAAEYADPRDRRFHAQPIACPACGPQVWLERGDGTRLDPAAWGARDALEAASRMLAAGAILAVKGIGGFHLAGDATVPAVVAELRRRKGRAAKPFALMARDLAIIRRYCRVSAAEAALLRSPAAPILLLERRAVPDAAAVPLASAVAPGQSCLGFMLPYSPLHLLLLAEWSVPLVMTSGNRSAEPQLADNDEARARLGALADVFVFHDRDILNRVDDSVARVMDGTPRVLRRGRGYAPAPLALAPDFAAAPAVLALGGELKNTFCLLMGRRALLSPHLGDLDEVRTAREFERTLALYQRLFDQRPAALAVDAHPDYYATRLGQEWAARAGLPLIAVQHHAAHIAAVLAEHGWPRTGPAVLGLALDGLGYGDDGTAWGGELLQVDYLGHERLARLKPVALPGGDRAAREPWRNLVAQLEAAGGWDAAQIRWPGLRAVCAEHPVAALRQTIARGVNAPLGSSCGRLFDAMAAALGICRARIEYEGQAAIELETWARPHLKTETGYPFTVDTKPRPYTLDPAPLWTAVLDDLRAGVAPERIAARFHLGLAQAWVALAVACAAERGHDTLALSGGVFQNRSLFELVARQARAAGLRVLANAQVPCNDGGLALGQAASAAARLSRGT